MTRRIDDLAAAAVMVTLLACNRTAPVAPQKASPMVRATVVTIVTTILPANKTYTHTITMANDRARSSDEADQWRLFDFAQKRVTFVDDVAKSYRNQSFADAVAAHRASMAAVPDGMPRVQFSVTGAQKTIQGVVAKQSIIRLGAYQRELWIASHPLIPRGLFAMLRASDLATSPPNGVMRPADEALLEVQGFPLTDHAELPYENKKLVVDNTVVKIEQRDVSAALLNVRGDYKEVRLPTAPSARPRPAS